MQTTARGEVKPQVDALMLGKTQDMQDILKGINQCFTTDEKIKDISNEREGGKDPEESKTRVLQEKNSIVNIIAN